MSLPWPFAAALVVFSVSAPAGEPGRSVPEVDVRASVLQLLQQAREAADIAAGGDAPAADDEQGPDSAGLIDSPLPKSVGPGELNPRYSIIEMLKSSRPAEPATPPQAEEQGLRVVPTQPVSRTSSMRSRPDWFEGELQVRESESPGTSHVPIPHKTFTIREFEDIDDLERALSEAREQAKAASR
jgi:hypothetical protein